MGGTASSMAAPFIISPTAKHTATVIFLHGLGDTGQGWSLAFAAIRQPHIRYVCPTANSIPVTLNAGFRMPAWFDIKGLDRNIEEDEVGIKQSAELLQGLITEEEKKGIPRSRIVVGGFSQGGSVALYSALAIAKPSLGGVLALSTWMPLYKYFPQAAVANRDTPILQCHGTDDQMMPFAIGHLTGQLVKAVTSKHEFKEYKNMGHSSCDAEMEDIKKFLIKVLPPV